MNKLKTIVLLLGIILSATSSFANSELATKNDGGESTYAGDKGLMNPEVNAYALRKLRPALEARGIREGYSNSRTCEIGLSTNGGITYRSIVYLVNACTTPKKH